ncbi:LacI family DNA-binding transcriptional regulator [Pseudomarimonas arenosa]|uniref:LacI family DNA-binding transcriptional regulator n=1 Tax=Pseudomarimonas arenosa TaxID=2774145 RepID=A0AAW3ZQ95_9GAMM|nr:LacI family DNA-binding transcriptional regulator [Pseudomarimonas arenosa]MBD8526814.1 LacI family DNA-binding transcriptional regulator [Pseudomarimonas arenosa]
MAPRVRIEDVAEAAGVSMKTVSRVLNCEPNVREQTRDRVMQAVEALNYSPHMFARSLAGNRTYLIALLYNNPSANYMMGVISGVLAGCETQQYNMLLCPAELEDDRLLRGVESLVARSQPDGVILTPPLTDSPALLERLKQLDIPYASISPRNQQDCICVAMDEPLAAQEMVRHLVQLGHRRIAHIIGHPAHGASDWRLQGYRRGLEEAGIAVDPELAVPGEFSFESGVAAARTLLDLPTPPTAIFAANDDMAAGVIQVALQRGLRIPQDLSVCGFDDTPMSEQVFPSMTTIHQPTDEMGRLATIALLSSLRHSEPPASLRVPHTLRLRQSSGPVPG